MQRRWRGVSHSMPSHTHAHAQPFGAPPSGAHNPGPVFIALAGAHSGAEVAEFPRICRFGEALGCSRRAQRRRAASAACMWVAAGCVARAPHHPCRIPLPPTRWSILWHPRRSLAACQTQTRRWSTCCSAGQPGREPRVRCAAPRFMSTGLRYFAQSALAGVSRLNRRGSTVVLQGTRRAGTGAATSARTGATRFPWGPKRDRRLASPPLHAAARRPRIVFAACMASSGSLKHVPGPQGPACTHRRLDRTTGLVRWRASLPGSRPGKTVQTSPRSPGQGRPTRASKLHGVTPRARPGLPCPPGQGPGLPCPPGSQAGRTEPDPLIHPAKDQRFLYGSDRRPTRPATAPARSRRRRTTRTRPTAPAPARYNARMA